MLDFFKSEVSHSIPNQFIEKFPGGIELWMKREDLLHPEVSGNKFRKLKYNILEARDKNYHTLLTFGGAHSNHIAATAAAGKMFGFKTIGIIRGNELAKLTKAQLSPTLKYAHSCGMEFQFVSREQYRDKRSNSFIKNLEDRFGTFYLLPEGGTNDLAIKGCEEILSQQDKIFDYICSPVGTGGTISGLINASADNQKLLGFSSLRSDYLVNEVEKLTSKRNWEIILKYHFGGYAKVNTELINFMNGFYQKYNIILDPVYTGKLVFGIFELIKEGYFPDKSRILAIHTGGQQGIEGMNSFLKKKNMPQINV